MLEGKYFMFIVCYKNICFLEHASLFATQVFLTVWAAMFFSYDLTQFCVPSCDIFCDTSIFYNYVIKFI